MSIVNLYRKDNQPFAQIPNDAIRDPRITPNAFRLLAYLMSHQDGYALTYDQIERQTTLGRKAINSAAILLTNLGWIAVDRPKAEGQFQAKSWTILSPDDVVRDATVRHATVRQGQVAQSTDIRRTLPKENKVNKKTTVKEISDSQKIETDFEVFWNAYAYKIQKPDALKAFKTAIASVSLELLLEAIPKYHAYLANTGINSANASTWLNQKRWENEYPQPRQQLNARQQQKNKSRAEYLQATSPTNPLQITDGDPF
jgi:DNA replication protein DnaC